MASGPIDHQQGNFGSSGSRVVAVVLVVVVVAAVVAVAVVAVVVVVVVVVATLVFFTCIVASQPLCVTCPDGAVFNHSFIPHAFF